MVCIGMSSASNVMQSVSGIMQHNQHYHRKPPVTHTVKSMVVQTCQSVGALHMSQWWASGNCPPRCDGRNEPLLPYFNSIITPCFHVLPTWQLTGGGAVLATNVCYGLVEMITFSVLQKLVHSILRKPAFEINSKNMPFIFCG